MTLCWSCDTLWYSFTKGQSLATSCLVWSFRELQGKVNLNMRANCYHHSTEVYTHIPQINIEAKTLLANVDFVGFEWSYDKGSKVACRAQTPSTQALILNCSSTKMVWPRAPSNPVPPEILRCQDGWHFRHLRHPQVSIRRHPFDFSSYMVYHQSFTSHRGTWLWPTPLSHWTQVFARKCCSISKRKFSSSISYRAP